MLREVTIKPALNGWIVRVGCQTLVFESTKRMLDEIDMYLDDPDAVERRYREQALNAKHVFDGAQVEDLGEAVEERQPEPETRYRVHEV